MFQDHIVVKKRHEKFIKDIGQSDIVFALENEDGLATSTSNYCDNDEGEEVQLICFWSEKPRAKSCIKDGWSAYTVAEISISDFLENWCVGMSNDGLLAGTNFDQNMFGYEIHPLELILEVTEELLKNNKALDFKKYSDILDLQQQVKAALKNDA